MVNCKFISDSRNLLVFKSLKREKNAIIIGSPSRVSGNTVITAEEEESFRMLAQKPDVYETVAKSIAPSIFGSEDIKKSIACLLFGGSRKRLPDGLTRRGDINVLLLGDPGTAKSQLLKFVERVSCTILHCG